MARWDQKDPRWIVQEREDGVNCGQWHWQEKDRTSWAKERLRELLPGVEASLGSPSTSGRATRRIRVLSVSSVDGDATQSTRKGGKKMTCYDLKLEMSWVAFDDDGEGEEAEAGEKEDGEEGGDGDGDGDRGAKRRKNEVKGELKVLEVATGHDEEDVLFEATVKGSGAKELGPREAVDALRRPVLDAIASFVSELEALELD